MNKKSTLKKSLLAFILLASTSVSFGQVIFTENFEGTPDPTTLLPVNWTETGLSTDGIFKMGNNTTLSSQYFVIPAHGNFAATNDDLCNCDKSADRLILPVQDFSLITTGLKLNFDAALFSQYGIENGTVEVSTDGGTTWMVIYNIPTLEDLWQNGLTANLNAYVGQANVLISFKYNDNADWNQGLAIDNVSIEQSSAIDASLEVDYGQYTIIPLSQTTPINITAKVTNAGINTLASTPITTLVFLDPNYTTPVTTFTQTVTNTAPGASASILMGVFTPTVIGDYYFYNYITTGDVNTSNDTVVKAIIIDQNQYARDNGTPTQGIGTNSGSTNVIGTTFNVVTGAKMDSVIFVINPPASAIGNIIQIKVSAMVGASPSLTLIGQSAPFTITSAHTSGTGAVITLPVTDMSNGPLQLAVGNYFVGLSKNTSTGSNLGLQCADDIFTPGTVFGSINGAAFVELNTLLAGFNYTPIIRPYLNPICTITASSSAIESTCGAADGSATVIPSNGTAPYTYLWSDNQTTATASNLLTGTYSVMITDASGCEYTVNSIIVNDISTLASTIASQSDVSCFGSTDGDANITVTGGTAPYTYVWTNSTSTTNMASNLGAGAYSVTVTDATSCSNTISLTISSPSAITATSTSTSPLCNGAMNGSAEVTVVGGTTPYTYIWTVNTSTTNTISSVIAGTYDVEITDANGCQATNQVVVTEPTALTGTTTMTPETVSNNGTANATFTGGTSPYTYSWSNGATTQNITGLAAGTYIVTATDANGCTEIATAVVTSVVGITEIENGSISLYPNPSQGIVIVSMDGIATGEVSMEILDITGKSVFTQQVLFDGNKTNFTLDLSSLNNGTYLIKLDMQEGTAIRRIILAD